MCSIERASTEGPDLDSSARLSLEVDEVTLLVRRINVRIYWFALQYHVDKAAPLEFHCECGNVGCRRIVFLSVDGFDLHSLPGAIRAH